MDLIVTILAGGLGKRMNSLLPKVLHKVNDTPMIVKILDKAIRLSPIKVIIVAGVYKDLIKETVDKYIENGLHLVHYAIQPDPLGTGNAVYHTLPYLDLNAYNLILNGDTPQLTLDTLRNICKPANLLITAIHLENPYGNGRIIQEDGLFVGIVEEKDCTNDQKAITLVNVGIYLVKVSILVNLIPKITNDNKAGEYYLTDIVKLYADTPELYILEKSKVNEIINVNTPEDLLKI